MSSGNTSSYPLVIVLVIEVLMLMRILDAEGLRKGARVGKRSV